MYRQGTYRGEHRGFVQFIATCTCMQPVLYYMYNSRYGSVLTISSIIGDLQNRQIIRLVSIGIYIHDVLHLQECILHVQGTCYVWSTYLCRLYIMYGVHGVGMVILTAFC